MKRRIYNAFRTTILLLGVGLVFLLSACDGFFADNDLDGKIKAAIEYANAKSYTLLIKSDSQYGEFLSDGEKQCKINNSIDIQFTANSGTYIYKGMEAVNKNNQSVSMNDYVELTETGTEVEHALGIYKINVKLIKESDEILIRPVCLLIPTVESYSPYSANYANEAITIKFNMPMEASETTAEQTVFNYNNISILYGIDDVSSCFETPYFNETKTLLTLCPKGKMLYDYISKKYGDSLLYFDIRVILGENIVVKSGQETLSLKQNSNVDFTVHYKRDYDRTAPQEEDFFLTRDVVTPFTNKSSVNLFSTKTILQFDTEEILQNRVKDYVYIYGKFLDADSGVKTITVKEHHTYSETGDTIVDSPEEEKFETTFTKASENIQLYSDQNGYTTFCIKYEVQSGNGAVEISVFVADACENQTKTKEYTIIKRATLDSNYEVYNMPRELIHYISSGPFDMEAYESNLKNIKIYDLGLDYDEYCGFGDTGAGLIEPIFESYVLYENMDGRGNIFTLYCEYIDKAGNPRHEKMNYHNGETKYWNLDLDVDYIENLEFKIIIYDDIGVSSEKIWQFPSSQIKVSSTEPYKNHPEKKYIYFSDITTGKKVWPYIIWIENIEGEDVFCHEDGSAGMSCITEGITYIPIPCNACLLGVMDLNNAFTKDITMEDVTAPTITSHSLSHNDENGYLNITVNIDGSIWDSVDRIIITEGYYTTNTHELENGQTCLTFKYTIQSLFQSDQHVYAQAIKNNNFSERTDYIIPIILDKPTRTLYDEVNPQFWSIYQKDYDYYQLMFADFQSGLEHVYIKINGKKELTLYAGDADKISADKHYEYWYFYLPVAYFEEGLNTVYAEVYDQKGNCGKDMRVAEISRQKILFKSVQRNSDGTWSFGHWASRGLYSGNSSFEYYFKKFDGTNWNSFTTPEDYVIRSKPDENSEEVSEDGGSTYTISNKVLTDAVKDAVNELSDTYIKIVTKRSSNSEYWCPPAYYFIGEPSEGDYDLMYKNGDSKTSIAIQSDKPVFVHTLKTESPYEECSTWSAEKWEATREEIGPKILNFSSDKVAAQKYKVPDTIKTGECYVIIAHYSTGETVMSEVMQK